MSSFSLGIKYRSYALRRWIVSFCGENKNLNSDRDMIYTCISPDSLLTCLVEKNSTQSDRHAIKIVSCFFMEISQRSLRTAIKHLEGARRAAASDTAPKQTRSPHDLASPIQSVKAGLSRRYSSLSLCNLPYCNDNVAPVAWTPFKFPNNGQVVCALCAIV